MCCHQIWTLEPHQRESCLYDWSTRRYEIIFGHDTGTHNQQTPPFSVPSQHALFCDAPFSLESRPHPRPQILLCFYTPMRVSLNTFSFAAYTPLSSITSHARDHTPSGSACQAFGQQLRMGKWNGMELTFFSLSSQIPESSLAWRNVVHECNGRNHGGVLRGMGGGHDVGCAYRRCYEDLNVRSV